MAGIQYATCRKSVLIYVCLPQINTVNANSTKQALRALTAAWGVTNGAAPLSRLEQIGATSRKHVCLFCSQFFRPDAAETAVVAKQAPGYTPFVDHSFDAVGGVASDVSKAASAVKTEKMRSKGRKLKKKKKTKKRIKTPLQRYVLPPNCSNESVFLCRLWMQMAADARLIFQMDADCIANCDAVSLCILAGPVTTQKRQHSWKHCN